MQGIKDASGFHADQLVLPLDCKRLRVVLASRGNDGSSHGKQNISIAKIMISQREKNLPHELQELVQVRSVQVGRPRVLRA